QLDTIRGVGETLREKITILIQTGELPQLQELRAATPAGLFPMLRVAGLGPKKVMALHAAGISDIDALRQACEQGRVAPMKGFGAKTQTKILEGLAFAISAVSRIRIDQADDLSTPILEMLRGLPGVKRAEACGSLRRRKETIGDLDFLVSAEK